VPRDPPRDAGPTVSTVSPQLGEREARGGAFEDDTESSEGRIHFGLSDKGGGRSARGGAFEIDTPPRK